MDTRRLNRPMLIAGILAALVLGLLIEIGRAHV